MLTSRVFVRRPGSVGIDGEFRGNSDYPKAGMFGYGQVDFRWKSTSGSLSVRGHTMTLSGTQTCVKRDGGVYMEGWSKIQS